MASIKIGNGIVERLDEESRRTGRSRAEVAETLIEEGLRMEAHPGIVFRPGPAGRRAAVAGGPDVWEIARIIRGTKGSPEHIVKETAKRMGQPRHIVEAAMSYYSAYREEIDEWMRILDEEANRAEDEWRRQQGLPPL